jgi:hypothetical protein
METIVTWNGQRFDPIDHASYRDARGYVAEFVTFHATEAGYSSQRIRPDVWRITNGADVLDIAIVALDGPGAV